jgi:MFS family permease
MTHPSSRDTAQARLLLLAAILFVSYLCIGLALPVVPVFVTGRLGLGNGWAGLATGIAFLSTILSRGAAGGLADRRGGKAAVMRGLVFYIGGGLASLAAGLLADSPGLAYAVLLAGRLVLGLGESLVAVGVISWGIALVGPARSGRVLALVGAALYGALAVGGPLGLALVHRAGFAATMGAGGLLPALGLLAVWPLAAVVAPRGAARASLGAVLGRIWRHGAIVCLQGIGFAAIGAFFALHFLANRWAHAGLGLTAFGAGFVLVRVLFGHLPDRVGGLAVATASLAVETLGQLLVWQADVPATALAGAFLTGLGCSLVFPAMGREVVQRVAPQLRGTALGAFSAFQDLAYGLTGPLAGLLADHLGYRAVFVIGAMAAALGVATALALRRARPATGGSVA